MRGSRMIPETNPIDALGTRILAAAHMAVVLHLLLDRNDSPKSSNDSAIANGGTDRQADPNES